MMLPIRSARSPKTESRTNMESMGFRRVFCSTPMDDCTIVSMVSRPKLHSKRRSKNFLIESIEALSEEFTMDEILADQNFPEVEKDFIRRRAHPKFDRVRFDKPSGINALTKLLGEARVALVSTAGAHCRSDPPFNLKSPIGDPTYREIPKNADLRDILLSHIGYDVREVSADKNSVFPLDRLR